MSACIECGTEIDGATCPSCGWWLADNGCWFPPDLCFPVEFGGEPAEQTLMAESLVLPGPAVASEAQARIGAASIRILAAKGVAP